MSKRAAAVDDRQTMFPIDLPPGPRLSSDEQARAEMQEMIETLAAAKSHPWSARLLGSKVRTFAVLAQRLTPVDAAALKARFDAELERLGEPEE